MLEDTQSGKVARRTDGGGVITSRNTLNCYHPLQWWMWQCTPYVMISNVGPCLQTKPQSHTMHSPQQRKLAGVIWPSIYFLCIGHTQQVYKGDRSNYNLTICHGYYTDTYTDTDKQIHANGICNSVVRHLHPYSRWSGVTLSTKHIYTNVCKWMQLCKSDMVTVWVVVTEKWYIQVYKYTVYIRQLWQRSDTSFATDQLPQRPP